MCCPIHPTRQAAATQAVRAAIDYDPQLLKPVHVAAAPAPGLSVTERARLHSELLSLHREKVEVERGITHLENLLAA